jgi:hypothetical protein
LLAALSPTDAVAGFLVGAERRSRAVSVSAADTPLLLPPAGLCI